MFQRGTKAEPITQPLALGGPEVQPEAPLDLKAEIAALQVKVDRIAGQIGEKRIVEVYDPKIRAAEKAAIDARIAELEAYIQQLSAALARPIENKFEPHITVQPPGVNLIGADGVKYAELVPRPAVARHGTPNGFDHSASEAPAADLAS